MFHTYIINAVGTKIDIDRAGYLMDDELAAEAMARVETDWPDWLYRDLSLPGVVPPPKLSDAELRSAKAQSFWAVYCGKHLRRYGENFAPDVRTSPL